MNGLKKLVRIGLNVVATCLPLRNRSAAAAFLILLLPALAHAQVRISAFYGNTGSSAQGYRRNFIELFNAGTSSVNLTNWTVQYAAATGTSWASRTITAGTIQPRSYFLIVLATSDQNTAGLPLPTADFTVSSTLSTSATAGKIALYSASATNTGSCPITTNLVDFIGYGGTADCRSPITGGALANNAPAPSATTALVRTNIFQTVNPSSNSNFADFIASTLTTTHLPRTSAATAVIVDGTAEAGYGAALAVQDTQTGFGNSNTGNIQTANGSELDGAYAYICGGYLHVVLAGNLETNGNRINLVIDSITGGQNSLRGDNTFISRMGFDGGGAGGPGMKFPSGMTPDYWVSFSGSAANLFVEYGTLPTSSGGTKNFMGQNGVAAAGDGALSGGDFAVTGQGTSGGLRATVNNSNTGGVSGGNGAASGAGVTTGVEAAIPLWLLGNPANPAQIRIFAFITSADFVASANQSLGGCNQCGNFNDAAYRDWSTTSAAAITVPYQSPTITVQPQTSISQCGGASTTISVTATGGTIFQWQQSTDGGTVWSLANGTNTTTATMTTATGAAANTRFRCVIVNGCGETVSNPTDGLVLNALPAIPGGTTTYTGAVNVTTIMAVTAGTGEVAEWFSGTLCTGAIVNTGTTYAFTPLAPGTYQFSVRARNTTTSCLSSTCLQVTLNVVPGNDQCSGSLSLSLNTPLSGTTAGALNDYTINSTATNFTGSPAVNLGNSASTAPGRDVVYTFTPATTDKYSVRVTNYPIAQNLLLYLSTQCTSPTVPDPVSPNLLRAANRNTGNGAEEVYCLSLTAGTLYYLYVDDTSGTNSGGAFAIEVNRCSQEIEANGTPPTATPYVLGDSGMEFTMSPNGEADFFSLGTPTSGSRIFALIDGISASTGDTQLRVTNTTGTLEFDEDNGDVAFGASGFSSVIAGTIADGNPLFLRANLFSSTTSTEPYRLYAVTQPSIASATTEVEPNDSTATAQTSGTNYFSGATASGSDIDTYAFTAYAGQMVFLGLDCYPNHTVSGTAIDGVLALLDPSGAAILSVNGASVGGSDNGVTTTSGAGSLTSSTPIFPGEGLVWRIRTTGTYYARVTAGNAGPYLLSISTFPAPNYCSAGSAACSAGTNQLHITSVAFNAISNTSADGSGSACYQDFTVQSTTAQRTLGYPIIVSVANDIPGNAATVWVDWNQNIDLTDTGEVFTLTQGPLGTYSGTVSVPIGASLGNTRLRVRVGNVANLPCGQTASGEVEDYTLQVQPAPTPPANDLCGNAAAVALGTPINGSTILATNDAAPSCDPAGIASRDVWYAFTAASAGIVSLNTCSSVGDAVLTLYAGPCGSLSEVACNDNCAGSPCTGTRSCLTGFVTPGTYYVRVGDKGVLNGINFTLSSTFVAAPANSTCAAAAAITVNTTSLIGSASVSNVADSIALDGSAAAFSCGTPTRDVFFTFTAPATPAGVTNWVIDTCSGSPTTDTVLQVLGTCGGGEVACNDDTFGCGTGVQSRVTVPVASGATVIIRVASKDAGGTFTVSISAALPGNDVCGVNPANFTIPGSGGSIGGQLVIANSEGNADSSCMNSSNVGLKKDVFYYFTPASSCGWRFSTCGTIDVDTIISIHSSCPTPSLSNQFNTVTPAFTGCNDQGCTSGATNLTQLDAPSGSLIAGTTYVIRVAMWSLAAAPGPFTLTVSPLAPSNDICSGASSVSTATGAASVVGDNSCATAALEAGQIAPTCGVTPSRDLWYTFTTTASQAGTWVINTCSASGTDTVLAICSGTCGSLTELACNDDAGLGAGCIAPRSELIATLAASTTYRVRVMAGAGSSAGGPFTLNFVYATAPTNDTCSASSVAAVPTASTPTSLNGNLQFATLDGPATSSACVPAVNVGNDTWYSFTTTAVSDYRFSTCGSATDTVVELWSECSANSGIVLACNDDLGGTCGTGSQVDARSLPVGAYRVRVANKFGTPASTFTLTISVPPPANDLCADASTLSCGSIVNGTTINATSDSGVLPASCVGPLGSGTQNFNYTSGVWYKLTLPGSPGVNDRTVTVDTLSTAVDTKLWVFTGACGSLTCVTANDDIQGTPFQSKVAFYAVAGTEYLILVGPFSTAAAFTLTTSCATTPVNDLCNSAAVLTGNSGSVSGTIIGATAPNNTSTSALPTCNTAYGFFDVWYTYTPACTGSVDFDTCGGYDTLLSIHTSCPTLTASNQVSGACSDNGTTGCTPGSRISGFPVIAGNTYLVRVAGAIGAAAGNSFTLAWANTNNPPTTPTGASTDVASYCSNAVPANITLTATGGSGSTLAWYSTSCGGTSMGTGSPLIIAAPSTSTTYFARWESPCGNSPCQSTTVTVNPSPTSPLSASVDAPTYCANAAPANIVLNAAGGSGDTLEWFAGSCGGTAVGTGGALSIAAPATTTTYYARWSNACGDSSCASVVVTVTPTPVAPTSAVSSPASYCANSVPATITLNAVGGSGDTLQWFTDSCGGTATGSGSGLIVAAPSVTTTYYARWSNDCGSSPCASVTVNVNPAPVPPTSAASSTTIICDAAPPADITLSATGGSGDSLQWFDDFCGGTPVGVGSPLTISTPGITTTYYARWTSASCGSSSCASVTVNVYTSPIAPSTVSVDTSSYCSDAAPSDITLTAVGGVGESVQWFNDSCGGTLVGSGPALTLAAPALTTTYHARWTTANCGSSACVSTTVTVNTSPVAPTGASASDVSYCADAAPASIDLSAVGGSGDTLEWFAGSCGGTPIGTGVTLNVPSPVTTTTYYARWTSSLCGSSPCASVTVTVQAAPTVNPGGPYFAIGQNPIALSGVASGHASALWSSSGSGLFGDATALSTTYTPSAADESVGTVTLTLTATAISPCIGSTELSTTLSITSCTGGNVVYVDDGYGPLAFGTPVAWPHNGGPGPYIIGCNAFATIQGGVNAVAAPGTVNVAAGNYNEDVSLTKTVVVQGAGPGNSIVSGPIGGGGSTFQFLAENTYLAGFTITRDGNTVADWNLALNSAGVGIQGRSSGTVADCLITGNRTGIDINASAGILIRNNIINDNRTGMVLRNATPSLIVAENSIANNWTVGVVFLDASSGTNIPPQSAIGSTFIGNNISGNWYGQLVDRQTGGSLPAPGANLKNFSGNWLGTTTPVISNANSAEPGYAAQIPVAFGGTAVPPGGQPDIAGLASDNFDITPFLNTGIDTDVSVYGDTEGFQGDFSDMTATDDLAQAGSIGRVQEAHDLVTVGGLVKLTAGSFSDNLIVSKRFTLDGAGAGTCAGGVDPLFQSILTPASSIAPPITLNDVGGSTPVQRLTISDLRITGAAAGTSGVRAYSAAGETRSHFTFSGLVVAANGGPGLLFEGDGAFKDVELSSSELCNNDRGLMASVTLAGFDGFTAAGVSVHDNSLSGLAFFGRTVPSAYSPTNITIINSSLAANGQSSDLFQGSGDLLFYEFNGNAALSNVSIATTGRRAIQFIGRGGTNPLAWLPLGIVNINNVDISGTADRAACAFLQYTDVSGVSLTGLDLSGMTSSAAPFSGFATVGMELQHLGASPLPLNDTVFPCQGGQTLGYVGLSALGTGGAAASCNTVFLGAATAPAKENCVFDTNDLSAVGDVTFDDVVITLQPTGGSACAGGLFTFTVNATGAAPLSYQWYRGLTPVGTDANIYAVPSASLADAGTYTVVVTNACGSVTSNAANLAVYPNPVTPVSASADISAYCTNTAPANIVLSAVGGAGDTLLWSVGTCGGPAIGGGNNLSIAAPAVTTTYFARWETASCGSSACASVTVTVNTSPAAPSSALADVTSYCSDSAPATITLSAAGGSGDSLAWYAASCGGTSVGTGNNLVIAAPTATTTYFARWESSLCGDSLCASVTVTVNGSPEAPTSVSSNISSYCIAAAPGFITLSAVGGSGDTLEWSTSACGGSVIGTGSPLIYASPAITTTYYARWTTSLCGSSACASTTVTVNVNPPSPTLAAVSPTQLCDGGSVTLSASVGVGETIDWYTGSCGGTFVGSGTSLATTVSGTTTFYAKARNIASGCTSLTCDSIGVTVYPSPVAPTSATSSHPTLCSGTVPNITLTVSGGSGDTLAWYATTCGGTPVGLGSPLTIAAPAVSTTYFARWETANCSNSTCISTAVNVQAGPTASAGGPYTICADGVAALLGSVTGAASSLWSTSGSGTFGNAASPITVYFPSPADISAGSVQLMLTTQPQSPCLLPASASVGLNILALPVAPTSLSVDSNNYCTGSVTDITLSASGGSGAKLAWYAGSCGSTQVGSGPSITIPAPASTTTYYASYINACGASACVPITVTVLPDPVAPTHVTASQSAWCGGSGPANITLNAVGGSGDTVQWFSGSCAGSSIGTGSSLTIAAPTSTTTYFARWSNACGASSCASTTITVNPLPVAPISANVDSNNYCSGSVANITLTASGGSGDVLKWYSGSCGTFLVGTGATLVIAAPTSGTTTYFARWESTDCGASSCVSIDVTVLPLAVAPASITPSDNEYCSTSIAELTLTASGGSGDVLEWFDNSCGGNLIGTGSPLVIPAPLVSTSYYARWSNSCGPSSCISQLVTVNPAEGACCSGWGTNKVCQVVAPAFCNPNPTPAGAYRGDCTVCMPTSCCPADYNNSGAVSVQDIFDFLADFLSPAPAPSADFNNNSMASPQDIFDFLAAYFGGC